MKTTKWLPAVLALSLAPALAFAQDNTADATKSTDTAAAQMNGDASKLTGSALTLFKLHGVDKDEIAAGNLALTNSDSAAVKKYGQKIIDDHTAADAKVTTWAKKLNVDLDEKPAADDKANLEKTQSMMDQMKAAKGADFDKQFLGMMIDGHRDAIELVTTARSDPEQKEIKPLLDQLLPKLRMHEKLAKRLQGHHAGMQPQGRTPDKQY